MTRTRDIHAGSADIVLRYVGDGRSARNVPADDLTGNDIARLAFKRDLAAVAQDVGQPIDHEHPDGPRVERPDPRNPSAESIRTVLDELLASGLYEAIAEPKPGKEPKPTTTAPTPTETPATPAEPAAAGDTPEVPTDA